MVWSFVFLLIINIFMRTWSRVRDALADPRTRLLLPVAAALVSVNWGTYIWAVNNGYVVESSLGYFINPLVSVALGVFAALVNLPVRETPIARPALQPA